MSERVNFDPANYSEWRATSLGAITEKLEVDLMFEVAGPVAGKSTLDIGTGDGTYALEAARRGAQVTALDMDSAMLSAARQRACASGLEVTFLEGDSDWLPFPDEYFDVVFAGTVFCFNDNPARSFGELARVLRPGGQVVIGELARYNFWAASRRVRGWLGSRTWRAAHFRTRRELERHLVDAGLHVERVRGVVHYPPITLAARLFAPIEPWLTRIHLPGAAFLVLSATKPLRGSEKLF